MSKNSKWENQDAKLASWISKQFESSLGTFEADPKLLQEQANHEDTFRTGGYSTRQLSELIQNAADAISSSKKRGRIEVRLTGDALYCANEGLPWTAKGLEAVTHAYVSPKDGEEIGRFGLGFKSTLSVTNDIQIFSETISFEFNSEKAKHALSEFMENAKTKGRDIGSRYPIFRTPTVIDVNSNLDSDPILKEMSTWATSVIKLSNLKSPESIAQQVRDFRTEFLLFANDVSSLKITIDEELGGLSQEHVCKSETDEIFSITTPSGEESRWLVLSKMHEPSRQAMKDVGEAIAREKVKISYAAPLDGPKKPGQFWAYYPLQNITTATGIFNAPWSVSDDRTNLLENKKFNEELLSSFVDLFISALPKLRTENDPARHFDYMPSRVNENEGPADKYLSTEIPMRASLLQMIPDSSGQLRRGSELVPLDFKIDILVEWIRLWNFVPHTRTNTPHHSTYVSQTRKTRLRDLFTYELVNQGLDQKNAIDQVPVAGIATWLTEFAQSEDLSTAADAIKITENLRRKETTPKEIDEARIIPTVDGAWGRPSERTNIFLSGDLPSLDLGFKFINPEILLFEGVESALKAMGFHPLDPRNELIAVLRKARTDSPDGFWEQVWYSIDGLPVAEAAEIIKTHIRNMGEFKVLTKAGTWNDAHSTLYLDSVGVKLGDEWTLDSSAMNSHVAAAGGVVTSVSAVFPVVEEELFEEYKEWASADFEARSSTGAVSRIQHGHFVNEYGPGPISLLKTLSEKEIPEATAIWTSQLLSVDADRTWKMISDQIGGTDWEYPAQHVWAISNFGLLNSSWGLRKVSQVLHPALSEFAGYLPVVTSNGAGRLPLIAEVNEIHADLWREFLAREWHDSHGLGDSKLVSELIVRALEKIPQDEEINLIPAVVGKSVVSAVPSQVVIGRTEDEQSYLLNRGLPHLMVESSVEAVFLFERLGCLSASSEVSFTLEIEGQGEAELATDLYPVLRSIRSTPLQQLEIVRCKSIAKRTTTGEGVEDNFVNEFLEEQMLYLSNELPDRSVFYVINQQLMLGLTQPDLEGLEASTRNIELDKLRAKCLEATSDSLRLSLLIGPKLLEKKLPQGLVRSLKAFGKQVDADELSTLFLDVYGFSALEQLKDELSEIDSSVPREWAGSSAASAFVKKYGFPPAFAGERSQVIERQFTVQGKPGLHPLHKYQSEILEKVQQVLTSPLGASRKAMVELPTGSGKTRVAVESIVRLFLEERLAGPVLWIAQTDELCEQAVQAWSEVWREYADTRALTIGRLWSSRHVTEPTEELSVVIATDAMLDSGNVLGREEYEWLSRASAVIIDEAHVAGDSGMYSRILKWLGIDGRSNERPLLGLSATPFKGTSVERTKRLISRFGNDLITIPGDDPFTVLQELGVLSRVKRELLKGTTIQLNDSEIADASKFSRISPTVLKRIADDESRTKRLVEHIAALDSSWPVLVFTSSVLSAQIVAALLKSQGISSAAISGETRKHERRRIIEQFRQGQIQVLTNCEVLTEGFDAPNVRALYIAKPTLSPNAYIQMAGRGLRGPLNGGSEECLIVDLEDSFSNLGRDLAYRDFVNLWGKANS